MGADVATTVSSIKRRRVTLLQADEETQQQQRRMLLSSSSTTVARREEDEAPSKPTPPARRGKAFFALHVSSLYADLDKAEIPHRLFFAVSTTADGCTMPPPPPVLNATMLWCPPTSPLIGMGSSSVRLQAQTLLYSMPNLLIYRCSSSSATSPTTSWCAKIRNLGTDSLRFAFVAEMKKTRKLFLTPGIGGLLPAIHAIFYARLPDGTLLGGILMDYISHTANLLIHPNAQSQRSVRHAAEIATLYGHSTSTSTSPPPVLEEQRGVPLALGHPASHFKTALVMACLEALRRLHSAGWVHGDTHLGNFLLDVRSWRVYLIDFERAFPSVLPVQQLLDVQELVGHATGVLLAATMDRWDMVDVPSVAMRLHPDASCCYRPTTTNNNNITEEEEEEPRASIFRWLPICTCFIQEEPAVRMDGCKCCRSTFNAHIAERYHHCAAGNNHNNTIIISKLPAWDLVIQEIKQERAEAQTLCRPLEAGLLEALPALQPYLSPLYERHPTFDPIRSQDDLDLFREWVQFIVYSDALISSSSQPNDPQPSSRVALNVAATLDAAGHQALADRLRLLLLTAATPPLPPHC